MKRRALWVVACAAIVAAALLRPRAPVAPPPEPAPLAAAPVRAEDDPKLARAMATFQVHEEARPARMAFRGKGYRADVDPDGLSFRAGGHAISMRATHLEQGGRSLALLPGTVEKPAFAHARIDRGLLTEEYLFENRRVEQVFRVPAPPAAGALRVRVAVETDLAGPVEEHPRRSTGWKDLTLADGGLAFCDETGERKLAYHGAFAIDARGRKADLDPKWEDGQIVLEVPAGFMAEAAFPLTIDPWLELAFSASGNGLSNTATHSQTPAVAVEGGGNPYVCWAEEADGDFDIFMRFWNGFAWNGLGGSDTGGGLSANTGDSTNPSIVLDPAGKIFVAWQDDTSLNLEIYFKEWTGTSWVERSSSANGGGVSRSLGESQHPSVAFFTTTIYSLGTFQTVPAIAWQDSSSGTTAIHLAAYFPGDPGRADVVGTPLNENSPPVLEQWYGVDGSFSFAIGAGGAGLSATPGGFTSERPRLARSVANPGVPTASRTLNVVWQDTRNILGGNYDIYFRRITMDDDANFDPFAAIFPTAVSPIWSAGIGGTNWAGVGGSDAGAGISGGLVGAGLTASATGLSINPALALDAAGNPHVAWEESAEEAPAVLPTRLDTEVLARRLSGGVWVNAGPTLNVSNTPLLAATGIQRSTTPSIAVSSGGRIYVAWTDDEIGNSEIYIKIPAGGAWGSAGRDPLRPSFGQATPPSVGLAGISTTFSASLFPSIAATSGPTIAWQDFVAGAFEIYVRRFYENEPQGLRQRDPTQLPPNDQLGFGATTGSSTVELIGRPFSENTARLVRMQVEVKPIGVAFVGTVTAQSDLLAFDGVLGQHPEAVVPFTGLVNVSYHWRARTVDELGQSSPWISAGGNADGQVDFAVAALPPGPPGAPGGPLNLSVVNGQVVGSWTPAGGSPTSYTIERRDVAPVAGVFGPLPPVGGAATSFTDALVVAGNTYEYRVTAVNGFGPGAPITGQITVPVNLPPPSTISSADSEEACGLLGMEALLLLALLRRRRRERRGT